MPSKSSEDSTDISLSVGAYCNRFVCVSVCLSVCLSVRALASTSSICEVKSKVFLDSKLHLEGF